MAPELVCMGHLVREMIRVRNELQGPFLGSPPAYCSVAAARQGTRTGVVSMIGPDMPRALLKPLTAAGVDTTGILDCGTTTATELVYDSRGNKEIRYTAKAPALSAADVPVSFHGCRIMYVCTMDNDVAVEDLAGVSRLGEISAIDLGGYGGVHMSRANRAAAPSLLDLACGAASHFSIVKASDEDAVSIFGCDDPEAASDRLLSTGAELVIVTQGSRGAFLCTREHRWQVEALPVRLKDATGGGDTFMAGFLTQYARTGDPLKAALWGAATAAHVIERTGGVHVDRMPTFDQVSARMRRGRR